MTAAFWTPRVRRMVAIVIGLVWLVSLGGTAATMVNGKPFAGFSVLILGWSEVPQGQPAWLANLFLPAALPLISASGRPKAWLLYILGIALMACAVAALFWRSIPDTMGPVAILSYGEAYYFWMTAVIATSLAAVATASMETDTL